MTKSETEESNRSEETFKTNFIISFFNMATELQILGMRSQASEMYLQGLEFSVMDLGSSHPLTEKLLEIKKTIEDESNKSTRQRSSRSTTLSMFNEHSRGANESALKAISNNSKKRRQTFI